MEKRPPLYALLFAPENEAHQKILAGRQKTTVREGLRDYQAGHPVMLCCHIQPFCVMADIIEVRHTILGQVTSAECEAGGYLSHREMLIDLRTYSPEIGWHSPVTVIRWDNIRGTLVDDWENLGREPTWIVDGKFIYDD